MADPIIGLGTAIEVARTYDAPKTVTEITKGAPPVVAVASHGYAAGTPVIIAAQGMAEIDAQVGRVSNPTADAFELEGVDATLFSTFTSGTVRAISAFDVLEAATSFRLPQARAGRREWTRLIHRLRQYMPEAPEPPELTIDAHFDASADAVKNIRQATRLRQPRVIRARMSDGTIVLLNCFVEGGQGFDMGTNEIATTQFFGTVINEPMFYPPAE